MTEKIVFKPRARLLLQLGDQLIRNEQIALLELIKNSYDADASQVKIVMKNLDNSKQGIIVVEDNGCGMDMNIIKNVWMEPGSDYKKRIYEKRKRTPKFGRLPLGEKGIGRFAVHKLGDQIELITRKQNHKEVYLCIDWKKFEEEKYLNEIPLKIQERTPAIFKSRTGTKIIIKNLKGKWTRGMIRDLYRSINSFCSPFNSPESFRIDFDIDKKEWLEGLFSWDEIKKYALFRFYCEIEGNKIRKFRYEFTPWSSMTKLKGRVVTENDDPVRKILNIREKENEINLNTYRIGKVRFEGLVYDRESRILKFGVQDKKGLKEYLDQNGGVYVYRDGVRVYDYGEPGNDWLNLDIRRVNIPTKMISNNIIIAAVSIKRDESQDLIEKTNREGFIENEAYNLLKRALLYALSRVEDLRYEDKNKIRKIYGLTSKEQPVISKIDELKKFIGQKIKNEDLKKEIEIYLDRIEKDYSYMVEVLLKSAGAGLSLSIVIHEIEKMIDELKKVVKQEGVSERIKKLIQHLARLIEGYTIIIRKSEKKDWLVKSLIEQAIFNMEYRFRVHNIALIKHYENFQSNISVKCARNLVINTIMNIFDNSIYWLEYADIKNKKIFITISESMPEHITLIIADNGPGFTLPVEHITEPFVSAKPYGMGLGLHIADEVMKVHEGKLLFPEPDEFNIPKEFRNGAIIALIFKRSV